MEIAKKYFIILCWVFFVNGIGIWLFTKGFLLKRVMIKENSTCHVNFTVKADNHGEQGCWMHKRFDKAVIIVIDALRFDFAAYTKPDEFEGEYAFQNKLKVVHELMRKKPQNSRLYKFLADPPTTTMQRIKGLTTGSLPTFVDAGANFASSEITEDNFIDQFVRMNKSITFMGDDTWMGLFPGRFKKAFPFPSFNVKDLHTVDDGVIKHLVPELKQKDWDLLIAHFLGVDHCGHRYGPYHPAMADKLKQMDDVIRSVVKELDDDTVLMVMGDHGMTRTGDHGGDSADELDAALFVYSPSKITASPPQKNRYSAVSQIDIVPTLSLLMGLPIPFSNLGSLIPHLFTHCPWWNTEKNKVQQVYHSVKSLRLNAHQVRNYLKAYAKVSDEFPYIYFAELDLMFNQCESQLQEMATMIQIEGDDDKKIVQRLRSARDSFMQYLQDVKGMCQAIWAKFDLSCMLLGSVTLVSAAMLLGNLLIHTDITPNVPVLMYVGMVGAGWVVLFVMFLYSVGLGTTGLISSLSLGFPAIVISTHVVSRIIQIDPNAPKAERNKAPPTPGLLRDWDELDLFATLCLFLYVAGMFSNSYVVHEDTIAAFFLQSLSWILFFKTSYYMSKLHQGSHQPSQYNLGKKTKSWRFDLGRLLTSPRSILLIVVIMFNVCIRLAISFRACREEQFQCELSPFLQPLSALTGDVAEYKNIRYFFSVICLVALPVGVRKWLKHYGNLNGYSPMVLIACYVLPLSVACVSFHWALQGMPQKILDNLPVWQTTVLPQIVYGLFGLVILFLLFKPLTLYIVKNKDEDDLPFVGEGEASETVVPKVYNHIKINWQKHLQKHPKSRGGGRPEPSGDNDSKPPMVYGLATVYSSTILILTVMVAILLSMLLGDGLAPSMLLQLVTMILLLELHATYVNVKYRGSSRQEVTWATSAMWAFLSSYFFFTTGHQATVTTIKWEAGYNGFQGDFDVYAIPATLITLNTFASHVLSIVALPLLVLWPLVRGRMVFMYESVSDVLVMPDRKGEFLLNEEPWRLRSALFRAIIAFLFFHGFKMVSAACAAGLHRRHLMVWKIFAPHFVFEAAAFILICVLVTLIYLLVLSVDGAINKWIEKKL